METYNYNQKPSSQTGFALIMALIISSVVISIGLSMLSITIKLVDLTATARESEVAFQAASEAMDCALMTRFSKGSSIITRTPATTLTFDCGTNSPNASNSGTDHVPTYIIEDDWVSPSGRERYVRIELTIIGEAADNRTYNNPDRNFTSTCPGNTYCTYIFAQGHNRSQADITSGASFAVQRELTAEF